MNDVKKELAKNIKYYRKLKNLTQKDLASLIGVKNTAVSNWESGQNSIDIETLIKLCAALEVSLPEIYGSFGTVGTVALTAHERTLLNAYRDNPELQYAVDKLLGICGDD